MKTLHHEINLKDLQDWLSEEEVLFASSSRERKRLLATLNGNIIIRVAGKEVGRFMQAFPAVEKYNSITEKYTEPDNKLVL